jgi:hypothetical protein
LERLLFLVVVDSLANVLLSLQTNLSHLLRSWRKFPGVEYHYLQHIGVPPVMDIIDEILHKRYPLNKKKGGVPQSPPYGELLNLLCFQLMQ